MHCLRNCILAARASLQAHNSGDIAKVSCGVAATEGDTELPQPVKVMRSQQNQDERHGVLCQDKVRYITFGSRDFAFDRRYDAFLDGKIEILCSLPDTLLSGCHCSC